MNSRRLFIKTVSIAAAGVPFASVCKDNDEINTHELLPFFRDLLADHFDSQRLGAFAVQSQHSSLQSIQSFYHELLSYNPDERLARKHQVKELIKQDFREGKIIYVDNWCFSDTELFMFSVKTYWLKQIRLT